MRSCIAGRKCICVRFFSVGSRNNSESEAGLKNSTTLSKDQIANSRLLSTLKAKETSGKSSQVPENGSSRVKTRSLRPPLPLSPLMDSVYIAAKEKPHLPKPRPPPLEERTPFQLELEKSPYAQALATPVRKCQITNASLPRFFLQDFEILAHPDTKQPWLMPRSIATSNTDPLEQRTRGTRIGPRSYAISRAALFFSFGTKGSDFFSKDENLLTLRMQKLLMFAEAKKVKRRKKLGVVVLELMRRRAVEALILASDNCMICNELEDVKNIEQPGAVLWVDRPEELAGEGAIEEGVARNAAEEPENFATLDLDLERRSKIPVHNLQRILGRRHVHKLRELSPKFSRADILALNHNKATIDVQLKLWKLQAHIFGLADEHFEAAESIDIATIKD